jgi:hypothetical protein
MEETMANNDASKELLNLWKSQEPQSISLSAKELRDASSKLERQIFWRNSREYLGAAIVVVAFGFYMYEFQTVLLRLGSGLTIAGALFVAFHLFQKGSASAMATDLESKSCVEFHRMELARQRDLLLTVWKWYLMPFVPGLGLFLLGMLQLVLRQPASHLHYGMVALWFGAMFATCAATFVLVEWLNRRAAKEIQKKIDALDQHRQATD